MSSSTFFITRIGHEQQSRRAPSLSRCGDATLSKQFVNERPPHREVRGQFAQLLERVERPLEHKALAHQAQVVAWACPSAALT